MYEHLEPLKEKLLKLKIESPPNPWRLKTAISVGGLESVGFDRHSDNLLIVSSQGRGVVNCLTGEKTARDYNDDWDFEKYYRYLEVQGIGDLARKNISMAGLYGGGLPIWTEDGWELYSIILNWPEEMIILVEPDSSLYGSICNRSDNFVLIEKDAHIRAYGFSYTNKSFIIATTSDVIIYSRGNNNSN